MRSPPVEETVAAHLCPAAAKTLGSDISLPSKPCRTTAYLSNKAYASDDEAASALHAMAVLQIFQPAGGGALTAEAVKDLGAATDFALMALFQSAWMQHFPRSEQAGCAFSTIWTIGGF